MIENEQLFLEIRELISKIIKIPEDKIFLNSNLFNDLHVDSLLGVEIFASLDKKYGLDIPEEKLKNINTVVDLVELIKSLLPPSS